ncbi:MAG: hypothetical protein SGJ16_13520 [Nitrospirota bacterium]|nr:hypothetical protein [Nitrospirota bacterium]
MEEKLAQIVSAIGPVLSIVLAALLVILGTVIIVYPLLIGWIVGIAFILSGVALIAFGSIARGRADM